MQDVDGDGDGALTSMLLRLRRDVLVDAPGLLRRLHRHLLASTMSTLSVAGLSLLYLWETLTLPEFRDPLGLFVAVFSSANAAAVFRTRGHVVLAAVDDAIALSRSLEASAPGPGSKARLATVARWANRVLAAYRTFITLTALSLAVNLYGEFLNATLTAVFKMYALLGALVAYYTLIPVHLIMYAVIAALFVAAAGPVQVRAGAGTSTACGVVCSRLQRLGRRVDLICGPFFPLILLVALLMPMVSLADGFLSQGRVTSTAVLAMPLMFFIYVPLCFGGQDMEDCSLAVGVRCYEGPWLAESVADRRCRYMVMQMTSVASSAHVHNLGKLNRPICLEAFRKWFSYFQMLLNLSHH